MNKVLKIGIIMVAIIFTLILLSTVSKAASFSASISKTEVEVGETFTVTVNANNAAGMYKVSADNSNVSKTAGNTSEFLENGATTITYKAVKAGTTTITAEPTDMTDLDNDENKVTGTKKFTVTIKEKETPLPEKATMTKVQVGDKTYTKSGFTVKVANDVTSIKIVPTISNGESYTINGGKSNTVKLEEGTNTIRIKLASGNSYKIYVRREAKVDDTPNVIEEKPEKEAKLLLKSLSIKGVKSEEEKVDLLLTPEFSAEVYEYALLLDETLSDITKLDIEAIAQSEDFTVEITGNEELKDGENIITITVKSKDGKNTQDYKIIVTKEAKTVPVATPVTTVEVEQEVVQYLWDPTKKVIITVFTSIIALMGIAYAIIEYRYTKEKIDEAQIPYSGINVDNEEDKEEMPFAKVGFEKEVEDKKDILKEEKISNDDIEEDTKKQTKPRRGKHF